MDTILIPDGPLDAEATLARYRVWGEDPTNRLGEGVFRRVLRLDGALVPYEVRWSGPPDDARLHVHAPAAGGERARAALVGEVRRVFGLDFDLAGFYRMAKSDRVLAGLVEPLYGLRPTLSPAPLEMLVHAIAAQQVNLTFAFALRAGIVRRWGTAVAVGGDTVWAFPEAATLAAVRTSSLRRLKFSTSKAESIRGVARAIASGELDVEALSAAAEEEIVERLTALRGIGRWTADWFMARCLGRGAVCPAGDLAVRKAFERCYGRGRTLDETAIRRRAAAWGPYQNLAIHYLLAGMRLARPTTGGGA